MNLRSSVMIAQLFVLCSSASAQQDFSDDLFSAARPIVPVEIENSELSAALEAGLWNPERSAVAMVIPRAEASLILVLLRRPDGSFLATDASRVEGGNFGVLGRPRTDYERFETQPVEWRQRDDGRFQVVMRTRAWRMGQRYTVAEALLIDPDGTVLYR
jgi:hypothetical protein